MSLPAFDGSVYRKTVLTPLRAAVPAAVDDVFWLGHVPRDLDDEVLIAARLKETRAFLHKERARPRQADVAAAVLKEWERIEGVLGDAGARTALRARLAADPGAGGGGAAASRSSSGAAASDPAARKRGQVARALGELARLREEPELAEDLFAFLGLPFSATGAMIAARLDKIGETNRRRRADRERSLVDELLMHSRELLVDGDPASYRAGLAADAAPAAPGAAASAPAAPPAPAPLTSPAAVQPPAAPAPAAPAPAPPATSPGSPKISYARPPKQARSARPPDSAAPQVSAPTPSPLPAPAAPPAAADPVAPPVAGVQARREPSGTVVVTWTWPFGVTEAFVAVGEDGGPHAGGPGGRKITNTKYELDGGATLEGIPEGAAISVHTGRRDASGTLAWNPPGSARGTIAP